MTNKEKSKNADENDIITAFNETFVLNTNTYKFHIPSCRSVKQMSGANKKEVTEKRADIIAEGYEPCKNCKP